ncbi:MAG: ABC transporter ATP-binding protein [Halioglobus sp.]|nr:ABC transporter ATP-binding protein [Halioglobus sp.]
MKSVICFHQVTVCYGQVIGLRDFSLDVRGGEVLALLGHNGAGKTTAMKLILGLIEPSAGDVTVFGVPPHGPQADRMRRRLGFLPEHVGFYEQLSGREVLDYFARLKRVDRSRIEDLLERVGLGAASRRRVKTYSKGMRQRLGLAQALLGEPQLLLFDEPTTGLDPTATRDFYRTVQTLRDQGCTVLLSSHVLPGIEPYVDRVLIIGAGRRLALGSLDELRSEAGLPLTIRIRLDSDTPVAPLQTLPAVDAPLRVGDRDWELQVESERKMAILRQLTSMPQVEDIALAPPTLEHLYRHFSGGQACGEAA